MNIGSALRRSKPLDGAQKAAVRRFFGGLVGVKVDFGLLDEDEAVELTELAAALETENGGLAWSQLSKSEQTACERLLEKSTGREPGTMERAREEARAMRDLVKFSQEQTKLDVSRSEESAFFAAILQGLQDTQLWADDVAVLTIIVCMFATGKTLAPKQSFEGSRRSLVLVVNRNFGLIGGNSDGLGVADGWAARVEWLAANQWLAVEKPGGPRWRISLGPKTLKALGKAK